MRLQSPSHELDVGGCIVRPTNYNSSIEALYRITYKYNHIAKLPTNQPKSFESSFPGVLTRALTGPIPENVYAIKSIKSSLVRLPNPNLKEGVPCRL